MTVTKVKLIKSPRASKKYRIVLENGKTVDFGASGYSDYTKHKNPLRMRLYVGRHGGNIPRNILNQKDPLKVKTEMLKVVVSNTEEWKMKGIDTAGFWSRWLLWSHPTIKGAKNIISKKFNIVFI